MSGERARLVEDALRREVVVVACGHCGEVVLVARAVAHDLECGARRGVPPVFRSLAPGELTEMYGS